MLLGLSSSVRDFVSGVGKSIIVTYDLVLT